MSALHNISPYSGLSGYGSAIAQDRQTRYLREAAQAQNAYAQQAYAAYAQQQFGAMLGLSHAAPPRAPKSEPTPGEIVRENFRELNAMECWCGSGKKAKRCCLSPI